MPARSSSRRFPPWTVIDEQLLYAYDPFLRLTRQHVRLPDGRDIRDYHQVVFPDYVTVAARTTDGRYLLVEKYNHGFRRSCMLFPGGLCDPGEPPRRAAARELLEETGYSAPRWRCLGHFRPHSNYGCGQVHFFLADGARPVAPPDSGDLEAMDLRLLSHSALCSYLRSGRNPSLSCAAAFALACQLLRLPGTLSHSPAKRRSP